jgi:hypothetical protein
MQMDFALLVQNEDGLIPYHQFLFAYESTNEEVAQYHRDGKQCQGDC